MLLIEISPGSCLLSLKQDHIAVNESRALRAFFSYRYANVELMKCSIPEIRLYPVLQFLDVRDKYLIYSYLASCEIPFGVDVLSVNASGRNNERNLRCGFGMPFFFHCDTACGLISQSTDTSVDPPKLSIIFLSVIILSYESKLSYEIQAIFYLIKVCFHNEFR